MKVGPKKFDPPPEIFGMCAPVFNISIELLHYANFVRGKGNSTSYVQDCIGFRYSVLYYNYQSPHMTI